MVSFGSSSSRQQSGSRPSDVTPTSVANLRDVTVVPGLEGLIGGPLEQGGGAAPQGVAPLSAGEQQLLSQILGSFGPDTAKNQLLEQTLTGQFLPGQEGGNPFLNAAIQAAQRPTLQGLEETLTRALPGRFTQAGQFIQPTGSSAFDRAAAISTRGAADALADIATNISNAAFESERGRQQQAIGLQQAEVDNAVQGLQAAALPRLIEQFGIDQGLEEFNRRIDTVLQALAISAGIPLQTVGQVSQSSGKASSFNFGLLTG